MSDIISKLDEISDPVPSEDKSKKKVIESIADYELIVSSKPNKPRRISFIMELKKDDKAES